MTAVEVTTLDIWLIVTVVVLIGFAGVLALAETSLTRTSRSKAQAMVDQGRRGAERVQEVVQNLERDLNSLYLAVLIAQTVQASLTGVVAVRLFGGWGVAVATVVNVLVVFVVAEAGPKTWALQHTERAALMTAPLTRFLGRVFRLPARLLIGVTNVILPGKGLKQGPFVTEEEILALAGEAAAEGGIEESERELIASIIDFGDTVVREIMVPRTEMVTMKAEGAISDMAEVAIFNGLSRFPVYETDVDHIVGVAYTKEILREERDGHGNRPVGEMARPAMYVPESKRVAELLEEMKARKRHLAIVVDEYGGTAGLVTLEDLLEELVGEIQDEFDIEEEPASTDPFTGEVVVEDPGMNLGDLNDEHQLHLPEGDWDSLGGLVMAHLGRVPEEKETLEVEGYQLTVEKMEDRRIARVRILALPTEEPTDVHADG